MGPILAGLVFFLGLWLGLQEAAAGEALGLQGWLAANNSFFAAYGPWLFLGALLISLGSFFCKSLSPFVGLICCCGLLGYGCGAAQGPSAQAALAPYLGQPVGLQGQVIYSSLPLNALEQKAYRAHSLLLQVEALEIKGRPVAYKERLRLIFPEEQRLPLQGTLVVEGTLGPLRAFRNPGGFDAAAYNRVQGLGGLVLKAKVVAAQEPLTYGQRLDLFNLSLRQQIAQATKGRDKGLLAGMLLGGRGVDQKVRQLFTDNGLAHLLSVSGTHVLLLLGLLNSLFSWLQPKYRRPLLTMVALGYGALCGFKAPIIRALAMALIILWAGKRPVKGALLMVVAMVMAIFKPLVIYDIGFQLSFGAAAGILLVQPKLEPLFTNYLPVPLGQAGALTLSAQVLLVPLLVGHFHQLSLISLVSNMLLVPVLELAALLALIGQLLAFLGLGAYLTYAAGLLVEALLIWGQWLRGLPYAVLTIGALPLWLVPVYYGLVGLWLDKGWFKAFSNKERKWAMGLLTGVLLCTYGYTTYGPKPMTAYFLDVGQGDCTIIETSSRQVIMLDTGGLPNYDLAQGVLMPFLRYLGRNQVDLLILSHWDYDHMGAAASLAQGVAIKKLLLPQSHEASYRLEQQLRHLLPQAQRAQEGTYSLGEAVIELLAVPEGKGNEASICLSISGPGKEQGEPSVMLFTGDADSKQEQELLPLLKQVKVFKAGHHGSKSSNSQQLLEVLQPQQVVISCGAGNRYGHPHREVLARLKEQQLLIRRTDLEGCIAIPF